MLKTLKILLVLLLLTLTLQANDKQTYVKAMELGLRQVAMIPAIMKSYVMVELKSRLGDPKADLDEAVSNFETYQTQLQALPLDKEMKMEVEKHQKLWQKITKMLKQEKSKAGFALLRKQLKPLRESIRKLIRSTKKKVEGEYCECVMQAGKLSAASQKFASLYMLLGWGDVNKAMLTKDMSKQKEIYGSALAKLEAKLGKDSALRDTLKKLKKDFAYFDFLQASTKTFKPALVYKKTNMMFRNSDEMLEQLLIKAK